MIEVVLCATGMQRHAPSLSVGVLEAGASVSTVECFDKCDMCERFLLCRLDGATMRFRGPDELFAAVSALRSAE